jgi:hypothetical protein
MERTNTSKMDLDLGDLEERVVPSAHGDGPLHGIPVFVVYIIWMD